MTRLPRRMALYTFVYSNNTSLTSLKLSICCGRILSANNLGILVSNVPINLLILNRSVSNR